MIQSENPLEASLASVRYRADFKLWTEIFMLKTALAGVGEIRIQAGLGSAAQDRMVLTKAQVGHIKAALRLTEPQAAAAPGARCASGKLSAGWRVGGFCIAPSRWTQSMSSL